MLPVSGCFCAWTKICHKNGKEIMLCVCMRHIFFLVQNVLLFIDIFCFLNFFVVIHNFFHTFYLKINSFIKNNIKIITEMYYKFVIIGLKSDVAWIKKLSCVIWHTTNIYPWQSLTFRTSDQMIKSNVYKKYDCILNLLKFARCIKSYINGLY